MAQWIIVAIAVLGLIYNSIVTHATLKNDVKHLAADVKEMRQLLNDILKKIKI